MLQDTLQLDNAQHWCVWLTSDVAARRRLCSVDSPTMLVLSTCRWALGDGVFPVAAARAWNSLPPQTRDNRCGWHQMLLLVAVCALSTLRRCWCCQPVDELSVTACFLWLQRGHGTVYHHRRGWPPCYWHFGVRPSLILSVSHSANGSLVQCLLIDS